MPNKIVLFPGWMAKGIAYGNKYEVLEIWRDRIAPGAAIEADWVVCHSLACPYYFSGGDVSAKTKIILVNPLIPQKSFWFWLFRFFKFVLAENALGNKKIVLGMGQVFFGLKLGTRLLGMDMKEILSYIPKDRIHIIRGKRDNFFCDQESADLIRSLGLKFSEVDAGHNWNENVDKEIEKIISASFSFP